MVAPFLLACRTGVQECPAMFFKRTPPAHIPIELQDGGFSKLLRQGGAAPRRLPDLLARRPEPDRFLRLVRIVGAARAIAASNADAVLDGIAAISDFKGDFTVTWRTNGHRPGYEQILDRAIASEGEVDVVHKIG
jgi:hypothetical protein